MKEIALLIGFIYSISIFAQAEEVKISPELEAFMELKSLDLQVLENNLYVGLIGFYLPQENFIEVTQEYFNKNDDISLSRMKNGDLAIDPLSRDMLQTLLMIADHSMDTTEDVLTYDNGLLRLENFIPKDQSLLKTQTLSYAGEKYPNAEEYFPCIRYLDSHCLTTTIERKNYIEKTVQDNRVFLDRLQWLANHSTHNTAVIPTGADISAALPTYQGINTAYFLTLSEAMLKITDGKTDEGLEQLLLARKWINLHYQPMSNPTLLDLVVTVVYKQYLDQTIDMLLNSGALTNHLSNPKLEFITQPYSGNVSLAIQKSYLFEFKHKFFSQYSPYVTVFTKFPADMDLSQEDQYLLLTYITDRGMALSPKLEVLSVSLEVNKRLVRWNKVEQLDHLKEAVKKASSNRLSAQFNKPENTPDKEVLKQAFNDSTNDLNKWWKAYFNALGFNAKDGISYLNIQHPSTDFFNAHFNVLHQLETMNQNGQLYDYAMIEKMLNEDYLHTIALRFGFPEKDNYMIRLNEQQNYHQLVYLKYLILKNKISVSEIPAFLESQGDLAKNTVTKEPYLFDAKTGILSTPLPKEGKHLPFSVRKAQEKDKSIQNFEVKIPTL